MTLSDHNPAKMVAGNVSRPAPETASAVLREAAEVLFPQVDAALASSAERAGSWLACRPGCHQCCVGVFPISPLDALWLREGLEAAAPELRERILFRAADSRRRLTPGFPGDPATGQLFTEPHHEEVFEDFANDEPCPVLDPATGRCELYASRPVPCRTFGPPVRDADDHLTVCELCFVGAPPEEVLRCEMSGDWRALEDSLVERIAESRAPGPSLIAFALTENQPGKPEV